MRLSSTAPVLLFGCLFAVPPACVPQRFRSESVVGHAGVLSYSMMAVERVRMRITNYVAWVGTIPGSSCRISFWGRGAGAGGGGGILPTTEFRRFSALKARFGLICCLQPLVYVRHWFCVAIPFYSGRQFTPSGTPSAHHLGSHREEGHHRSWGHTGGGSSQELSVDRREQDLVLLGCQSMTSPPDC